MRKDVCFLRKYRLCVLTLLLLAFGAPNAWAVPASPFPIVVRQPDGARITLYTRGDESQHWVENPEGYSLAQNDATGYWEFAVTSGETLVPSGVVYRTGVMPPAGVTKHARPEIRETARDRATEISSRGATWTPQPVSGARKILLVRVGFVNRALATDPAIHSNGVFGDTNSVKKYYADQSKNTLTIESAQGGTSALSVNLVAGDANSGNHPDGFIDVDGGNGSTQEHLNEVAFVTSVVNKAAAAGVDFASFDTNADGKITPDELCVYLIVAGYEESAGALTPSVWAHAWESWNGSDPTHQVLIAGKLLTDWAMNGEYYDATDPMSIGTICHELGHQFCRLPDMYDVSKNNEGLGNFSLMAGGSWGAVTDAVAGSSPVNLDAWCRQYLGWETPSTPSSGAVTLGIPYNGTHAAIRLLGSGHRATEYFLVEVRSLSGWDAGFERFTNGGGFSGFPGGLLILHVDEEIGSGSLSDGNDFNEYKPGSHQGCMAAEADGPHLAKTDDTKTRGSQYTTWFSGNPNYVGDGTFTGTSTPNSDFYPTSPTASESGKAAASGISITNISAGGDTMTCTINGGADPTPTTTIAPTVTPTVTNAPTVTGGGDKGSGGGCSAGVFAPFALLLFVPLFLTRK